MSKEMWVACKAVDGKTKELCEFERAKDVILWLKENNVKGAVLQKVRRKA